MSLFDAILNCVALLLWLNWRSIDLSPNFQAQGGSLLSTLKRVEMRRERTWIYLVSLILLLLIRPWIYVRLAEAGQWAPTLDLGVVALTFRAQDLGKVYVYSIASFLKLAGVFYWFLLFLCMVHRKLPDTVSYQRFARLHLGPPSRWPVAIQASLAPVLVFALWTGLQWPMLKLGLIPKADSSLHVVQQALVLALSTFISWAFPLAWLLGLHIVNSYVYLGTHDFWNYVNATAREVLRPFRILPLTIARVDFAPMLAMFAAAALDHFGMYGLTLLYRRLPV